MKCPFCNHADSKVIDSRDSQDGGTIRRRRECEKCEKRFTTYERVEESFPVVIKKDGRREEFDRHKIFLGIRKACEKSPISVEKIETLVRKVEKWVSEQNLSEIPSPQIGEKVMEEIHPLDEVAYVRFASVYRSFKDINEFKKELEDLLGKDKR